MDSLLIPENREVFLSISVISGEITEIKTSQGDLKVNINLNLVLDLIFKLIICKFIINWAPGLGALVNNN